LAYPLDQRQIAPAANGPHPIRVDDVIGRGHIEVRVGEKDLDARRLILLVVVSQTMCPRSRRRRRHRQDYRCSQRANRRQRLCEALLRRRLARAKAIALSLRVLKDDRERRTSEKPRKNDARKRRARPLKKI
jgi:hypothetical protein